MKNGEFSGLSQNENLTTEVYSSDRPENYGYTEEEQLVAVDPQFAKQSKAEKLALEKLGHIPSPSNLPRGKELAAKNKELAKAMMSPLEKHRYEKAMSRGRPWDDKYKDHPREKISDLVEDPAGKEIDFLDDDFNNIEG